jgi:hypothetical protein
VEARARSTVIGFSRTRHAAILLFLHKQREYATDAKIACLDDLFSVLRLPQVIIHRPFALRPIRQSSIISPPHYFHFFQRDFHTNQLSIGGLILDPCVQALESTP